MLVWRRERSRNQLWPFVLIVHLFRIVWQRDTLFGELLLEGFDVYVLNAYAGFQCYGGCRAGGLAEGDAVRDKVEVVLDMLVRGESAAGHQEIVHVLWQQRAVRNVHIGMVQRFLPAVEVREDGDGIFERLVIGQIFLGELILANHAATGTGTKLG